MIVNFYPERENNRRGSRGFIFNKPITYFEINPDTKNKEKKITDYIELNPGKNEINSQVFHILKDLESFKDLVKIDAVVVDQSSIIDDSDDDSEDE